jgi:hypothetical protein
VSELIIQLFIDIAEKYANFVVFFANLVGVLVELLDSVKIIDFVEHVSMANSIYLVSCCKNHFIFKRRAKCKFEHSINVH